MKLENKHSLNISIEARHKSLFQYKNYWKNLVVLDKDFSVLDER